MVFSFSVLSNINSSRNNTKVYRQPRVYCCTPCLVPGILTQPHIYTTYMLTGIYVENMLLVVRAALKNSSPSKCSVYPIISLCSALLLHQQQHHQCFPFLSRCSISYCCTQYAAVVRIMCQLLPVRCSFCSLPKQPQRYIPHSFTCTPSNQHSSVTHATTMIA